MVRWNFCLLLEQLFFILAFVSLQRQTIFDITAVLPCITNITSNYYGQTDFLFISDEIRYLESNDILLQSVRGPVLIEPIDQFAGHFGFFLLFPGDNKSYQQLLQQIQPNIYNK